MKTKFDECMNKWQRIDEQNNKRRKRIYNEHNGIKTKQTEECLMEMHEIDSEGINSYPEDTTKSTSIHSHFPNSSNTKEKWKTVMWTT